MDLKTELKNKKLIIFDLDGTLIDSLAIWNKIDERVVATIRGDGKTTIDNMQVVRNEALRVFATSPNPYEEYCRYLKDMYKSQYTMEEIFTLRYSIAGKMLEEDIDFKPYAPEFIKKLKAEGKILAIASAAQAKNMTIYRTKNQNLVSKARFDDYFSVIYTRNDCHEIKPHPEVFLKVLTTLGISAEDAFVFEDSLVGVEASKRAGIKCCAVYDRFSDHERDEINALADYTIDSFGELI
ncbi:MAG: HAD family phosphatase [Clostridia bacterium]|nr:HAD family phosphatase [Clostridia bacterium]